VGVIWRGRGWLAPLLLLVTVLAGMATHRFGWWTSRLTTLACVSMSTVAVAWIGARLLLAAPKALGRPLAWWEWVFDFAIFARRPFHSFMFVQLVWWTLGYAFLVVSWAGAILRGEPPSH
jgi:hypothetical protein